MNNQLLEMTSFKEWMHIKEVSTSTGDIAGFQRIAIPLVRRMYPNEITFETKKKKKPYKQPQVES